MSLVLLFMIVFDLCQSYTQYSNLVCHVGSQSAALTSTSCGFTTHSPGATLPLHKPLGLYQSVAVAVRLLGEAKTVSGISCVLVIACLEEV